MGVTERAHYVEFRPGPFDAHMHPRIFDVITRDNFVPINEGQEGKAGLREYTETALFSGFTGGLAMPNESVRLYAPGLPEHTETLWYPVANIDRVRAAQAAISHESVILMGQFMGLDPKDAYLDYERKTIDEAKVYKQFWEVRDECPGLKIYAAETTNQQNVEVAHVADFIRLWDKTNHGKPVVIHAEDQDVEQILQDVDSLPRGRDIAIHIAHVSSKEELEAIIFAKKQLGMNVTCEATPHHLFLDESARALLGGYGCMKPSLKTPFDVKFLWQHIDQIDIFASDCAPHRRSDKEANPSAFGVVNHSVMVPLLLGAVADGKLPSSQMLFEKLCVGPRRRFNLPVDDGSLLMMALGDKSNLSAEAYDLKAGAGYGETIFAQLEQKFRMLGSVMLVQAGESSYANPRPSYRHLIRPGNL